MHQQPILQDVAPSIYVIQGKLGFITTNQIRLTELNKWLPLSLKIRTRKACQLTKLNPNFWERGLGGEGKPALKNKIQRDRIPLF